MLSKPLNTRVLTSRSSEKIVATPAGRKRTLTAFGSSHGKKSIIDDLVGQLVEPVVDDLQQNEITPAASPRARPAPRQAPQEREFSAYFDQLAAWKQQHLSTHVPRFCFDAPELGAWVRQLRKTYKLGQLEQWKIDR